MSKKTKKPEVRRVEDILKEVTPEQEAFIVKAANEGKDIMTITREVFCDNELNGRSAEGKAVREVLLKNGVSEYKTTLYTLKNGDVSLSESDKDIILRVYRSEKSAYAVAKTLWPDKTIHPSQKEVYLIQDYVKSIDKKGFSVNYVDDSYNPPFTIRGALKLVQDSCNVELEEDKLNSTQKRGVEKLLNYLKSPRFLLLIRSYNIQDERDLFEAEFVRATWDKPDLTPGELNLCINLCQEYVFQLRVNATQNMLQQRLDSIADTNDETKKISISLVEALKDQADQLHKSSDRQRKLNDSLEGLRKERLDKKTGGNRNIAALVEAMQEEDNRKKALALAKQYESELKDEIKRMDGLEDFAARIFGMSTDDF